MSALGDVLNVMHRDGPRYRTLRAVGVERRHVDLQLAASRRDLPEGTATVAATAIGPTSPTKVTEEVWRLWHQPPERTRAEFGLGTETVSVVFQADTWTSVSAMGAMTNGGRQEMGHGKGPGIVLFEPAPVLGVVEFEVLGRTQVLDRPAHRVLARPIPDVGAPPSLVLRDLGIGADNYELLIDAERGFLLRSEARLDGQPFRILEVTELGLDEDLPPHTFILDPPPGKTFTIPTDPERFVSLNELTKLVPFTIFVPRQPPGTGPVARLREPDDKGAPLTAMVGYIDHRDDVEDRGLWLSQSATPLPLDDVDEIWSPNGDLLITHGQDHGEPYTSILLTRQGTHIRLDATGWTDEDLTQLADNLESLPPVKLRTAPS
jgi:hypothetical protein